jgi:hypothetical protein
MVANRGCPGMKKGRAVNGPALWLFRLRGVII